MSQPAAPPQPRIPMRLLPQTALVSLLTTGCLAGTGPDFPDFGANWPLRSHWVEVFGTVAFGGRTDTRNDSVHVVLTFTNVRGDSARIEFGVCSFAVLAEGPGGVRWDNRPAPNTLCPHVLLVASLGPRESKEHTVLELPARAILADSLPAGVYRFSIFYRDRGGNLRGVEAGEARLSAAE